MLADLGRRLRFEPDDVGYILPFEEVIDALGRVSEHDLGLQTIALDSIVGTVDRTKEFDRAFRPTSPRLRARWQRIAEAQRRGSLVVVCDIEAIVKTFKITGLDGVFTLVPSLDDALDGDAVGAGP